MGSDAKTTRDYEEQAKRIADLEQRLACVIDIASVMRDQVGTGLLLTNVRNGFQTILDAARGTVVLQIK